MALDNKEAGLDTRPHPQNLAGDSFPRNRVIVERLKAAVWAWRLRVPHGTAGHYYFAALERQLAAHAGRNLEAMLWQGWPPDQAQAAASEWLHDLAEVTATIALERIEAGK